MSNHFIKNYKGNIIFWLVIFISLGAAYINYNPNIIPQNLRSNVNRIIHTIIRDSNYNGKGFNRLMETLESIYTYNTEQANNYLAGNNINTDEWELQINFNREYINSTKYHKSYKPIIEHTNSYLDKNEKLLQYIEKGKTKKAKSQINEISDMAKEYMSLLAQVLDKNGISYDILIDGSIKYYYKEY